MHKTGPLSLFLSKGVWNIVDWSIRQKKNIPLTYTSRYSLVFEEEDVGRETKKKKKKKHKTKHDTDSDSDHVKEKVTYCYYYFVVMFWSLLWVKVLGLFLILEFWGWLSIESQPHDSEIGRLW